MTTSAEVALLRLVAQRLVGPPSSGPAGAVGHLLAAQAQDLPGALTSIALRTAGRSVAEVRAAFDAAEVVRSWPMRGTLHAVPAVDLSWMLELMTARPLVAAARRREHLGLSAADLVTAAGAIEQAIVRLGGAATRAELIAALEDAGLPTAAGRAYHLLTHLATTGVVCLGPFRGTEQLFVMLDTWVPSPRRLSAEEARAELALRYLRGHGPASAADLARWSGLPLGAVRAAIADVADQLEVIEVDGVRLHLDPSTPALLAEHRDAAMATLLLPGFDELVLGYADRTATLAAEHAERVVPGGNGVFRPIVVTGGRAVATWRLVGRGRARGVEVERFGELDHDADDALLTEATALVAALP